MEGRGGMAVKIGQAIGRGRSSVIGGMDLVRITRKKKKALAHTYGGGGSRESSE